MALYSTRRKAQVFDDCTSHPSTKDYAQRMTETG